MKIKGEARFIKTTLAVLGLSFLLLPYQNCSTKKSFQSQAPLKLSSLSGKTYFLFSVSDSNGVPIEKAPYTYTVDHEFRNREEFIYISQPPSDCNSRTRECIFDSHAASFNQCRDVQSMMGCDFVRDLSNYYEIPDEFKIYFDVNGIKIIDLKTGQVAKLKELKPFEPAPIINEPPEVDSAKTYDSL